MIDYKEKYFELQKKYQTQQKNEFVKRRKTILYQARLKNIIFIFAELILSLAPSENIEKYVNKIKDELNATKI